MDLWAFLMQRDFPEHSQLARMHEKKLWYQDLHKYGAYWIISSLISLFPDKPLYVSLDHVCSQPRLYVTTTKNRTCGYEFPRYYGEQHIMLFWKKTMATDTLDELLKDNPHTYSIFFANIPIDKRDLLFIAHKQGTQIKKLDTKYDTIIAWIHSYFEVKYIKLAPHQSENNEYFTFYAKLLRGHIICTDNTTIPPNPEIDISCGLTSEFSEYRIFRNSIITKTGIIKSELYSSELDECITINCNDPPSW
jgi:hypothetical protein